MGKKSEYSSMLESESSKSPAELDRAILQYARENVAEKSFRPRWIPALATVSVVGLAVMLVMQQLPQSQQMAHLPAVSRDRAIELDDSSATVLAAPSAEKKDVAAAINPVMARKKEQASLAASESFAAKRSALKSNALSESSAMDYEEEIVREQDGSHHQSLLSSIGSMAALKARVPDVQQQLIKLRERWQNDGDKAALQAEYQAIRDACDNCSLPEKLHEYIAQLEDQQAKPHGN